MHAHRSRKHPLAQYLTLAALTLAACDTDPPSDPDAGIPPAHPPMDASPPDASALRDAERLAACPAPNPCPEGLAQLIENQTHNIHTDRLACVLAALAQRTPGRYTHQTDSTFSNGSVGANHTLVIAPDGTVAYARQPYQFIQSDRPAPTLPPDPSQRCTLRPATYFETCRAAVQATAADDTQAWVCAFGNGDATTPSYLDWFEACEVESPSRCE